MSATRAGLLLFLLILCTASCGYLDEEILVGDEAFEGSFGVGGIGLSGYGSSSGCGGFGYGRGMGLRAPRVSVGQSGSAVGGLRATVTMSDAEILEFTDVESVEEGAATGSVNLVERMYFSAVAERDRGLAETY